MRRPGGSWLEGPVFPVLSDLHWDLQWMKWTPFRAHHMPLH